MVSEIIQGGIGAIQTLAGALSQPRWQKYQIPQAIKDLYASAKGNANQTRMPGQDQLEADIADSASAATRNVENITGGSGAALGAISKLYGNQINAERGITADAARYHQSQQAQLARAQQIMGNEQNKQFQHDVVEPYDKQSVVASGLAGAGISNVTSSINNWEGEKKWTSMIDKMFGKGGVDTTGTGQNPTITPTGFMGAFGTPGGNANPYSNKNMPFLSNMGIIPQNTNNSWMLDKTQIPYLTE